MHIKSLVWPLLFVAACGAQSDHVPGSSEQPSSLASSDAVMEALDEQRARFATTSPWTGAQDTAYAFTFDGLVLDEVPLAAYEGEPILVVNTASRCGYTPQYKGLQTTYERFADDGLVVLGVPSNDFGRQEPGSAEDIEEFCRVNFGVTFPMTQKYVVQGPDAHPFYQWAAQSLGSDAVPKWNFHKILIGRDGQVKTAFASAVSPTSPEIIAAIENALKQPRSDFNNQ